MLHEFCIKQNHASADKEAIAIAEVIRDENNDQETVHISHAKAVNQPNSCVGEALGFLFVLKQTERTIQGSEHYEATTCNDNKALIEKTNERELCGNYGLHAGMAIIIEIREMKRAHNNIIFKWTKGHQEITSCC